MSLNGDIMVIRNGRSTSQISIYNYPEHLNPFYEDDQHKRLRFWQINRKNDNEGRRNSFSISGLKDMWAFKSFRLKKKSSTLGINKTSESPPTLRRADLHGLLSQNTSPSVDRRSEYNNDDFQRNAYFRSSLQNMNTNEQNYRDIDFSRNNQARRTVQYLGTMPNNRSVTPQSYRRLEFNRGHFKENLPRGPSQNPFDTEDDENDENSRLASTPKRTPKKKRRAPIPPVMILNSSSEINQTLPKDSSHINSQDQPLHIEESLEIANLTAEIENFVKTTEDEFPSNNSTAETTSKHEPINKSTSKTTTTTTITTTTTTTVNNMHTNDRLSEPSTKDTPVNATNKVEQQPKSNGAIPKDVKLITVKRDVDDGIKVNNKVRKLSASNTQPEMGQIECIHVHVENRQGPAYQNKTTTLTSFSTGEKQISTKGNYTLSSPPTVKKDTSLGSSTQPIEKLSDSLKINELKIVEDESNRAHSNLNTTPTNISRKLEKPPIPVKSTLEQNTKHRVIEETQILLTNNHLNGDANLSSKNGFKNEEIPTNEDTTVTLKPALINENNAAEGNVDSMDNPKSTDIRVPQNRTMDSVREMSPIYRSQETSNFHWKKSTLAPLESNVPPEKRKSVKDIIESINRSQRLLNASAHKGLQPIHQNSNDDAPPSYEFHQQEILDTDENNFSRKGIISNNNIEYENKDKNDAQSIYQDPLKPNNSEIFKKGRVHKKVYQFRESSPTESNLDWNPLPKPRRTKNLSDL